MRGSFNSWNYSDDLKFSTSDGNTYILNGVTLSAGTEFKIGMADWSSSYGTSQSISDLGQYWTSDQNAYVSNTLTNVTIILNISAYTITITYPTA